MSSTVQRPKLDQELARRYVERAAKDLSSWPGLQYEDRVNLFFTFAKGVLPIFNLKDMRPMGVLSGMPCFSQYFGLDEWHAQGWEIMIAGTVYDGSDVEDFGGGIMVEKQLFSHPVAAGAIGVFSHAVVTAIQREIDEVNKEGLRAVANGPSAPAAEFYQSVKSAECSNFHALVAMEMRFIPEYAEHLPEKIEVFSGTTVCGICSCEELAGKCDGCHVLCCKDHIHSTHPDGTGLCPECHQKKQEEEAGHV